ncbi:MAG: hypothetical protein Q4F30_05300 [Akkermansia sp.]|nr:hypothetical protein [Akkermansia sp.]
MTHHYRHWFNTAILRRVAVFTLSMFESVAPLTQGQETADEEEEVQESLIDFPKAQDDKKKALEALLQEPEKHADQAAEQVEPSTTLSDSELYMLNISLEERKRRFEQQLDGHQDTTDTLVRKAIADMQAVPIPVGKSASPDRPTFQSASPYELPDQVTGELISSVSAEAAAFLVGDGESAVYDVPQAASPLLGGIISTAAVCSTVAPPAAAPLTYGSGAPAFSGGEAPAGGGGFGGAASGGGGGASSAAVAAEEETYATTPATGAGSAQVDINFPARDEIALQPDEEDEDEKKKNSTDSDALLTADSMLVVNAIAPRMAMAAMADQSDTVIWNGKNLADGQGKEMVFDSTGKSQLDVGFGREYATNGYEAKSIVVELDSNYNTKRGTADGKAGYALTSKILDGTSLIEQGGYITGETSITKRGTGILVMEMAKNDFTGGVFLEQGVLYVAEEGSLGKSVVTMSDGTAMWVNLTYTAKTDTTTSFRRPIVSNDINLADGTTATISYGNFAWHVTSNPAVSSRVWRDMTLTGQLTGGSNSKLILQGYTSRGSYDQTNKFFKEVWYSQFSLKALTDSSNSFQGTIVLANRVNSSDLSADSLKNGGRASGPVRLNISDAYLKYATLDLTREFVWNTYDNDSTGLAFTKDLKANDYDTENQCWKTLSDAVSGGYNEKATLHQTNSHALVISDTAYVGELKADLLGITTDTYMGLLNWSEQYEVKHVKVVTGEKNATLVLGKTITGDNLTQADMESWYSGTMGLAGQFYGEGSPSADISEDVLNINRVKALVDTEGGSVAGLSLTKTGNNTQYIHTAELVNLKVEGGTLGFNNLKIDRNLQVNSGSALILGVTNEARKWTDENLAKDGITLNKGESNQRFLVYSNTTTKQTDVDVPVSAVVEGNVTLGDDALLSFELDSRQGIVPIAVNGRIGEQDYTGPEWTTDELKEHSLLRVEGTLTLSNKTAIALSGVDFLQDDYEHNTYYLAAADRIAVGQSGSASDFSSRIIRLHYGFYGILSTVDGHGSDFLVMTVATDPTRSWSGAGVANTCGNTNWAANVWKALPQDISSYTEYRDSNYGKSPNSQWKENRAYTDGVSVKFGNLWIPKAWEDYLKNTPDATIEGFTDLLTSSYVTKGYGSPADTPDHGTDLFSGAATTKDRTSNGIAVSIGGMSFGSNDSVYGTYDTCGDFTKNVKVVEGTALSNHYECVLIDGTVRPGYMTVNSNYELMRADGSYVSMKDDTNYVFKDGENKGCIADASATLMGDIYNGVVEEGSTWRTKLAKGGTGTLIIETENTFSGGTDLHGGLTVMKNRQALGWSAESLSAGTFSKGGEIEMAYGAALMPDYVSDTHEGLDELQEGVLTNHLVITHMADFDDAQWKVTGDAQILNRWDTECRIDSLESYMDAVLTLRGVSHEADDSVYKTDSKGVSAYYNTYADYAITTPKGAYGTIRMAGYLYGDNQIGWLTDADGYVAEGGNVQLAISGHNAKEKNPEARWDHVTIDLSLNGSANNVLALETRFIDKLGTDGKPTGEVIENANADEKMVTLSTLKDDVARIGNVCPVNNAARVINDASSERLADKGKYSYLVTLTLNPTADSSFSGNVGYGIGQNAAGAALPSRGYISLVKTGATTQYIGNAKLKDLTVGLGGTTNGQDGGVLHIGHSLSVCSITTSAVNVNGFSSLGRILVGDVDESQASHTVIVGAGGILAFETATSMAKPLENLQSSEAQAKYGSYYTYVLLQGGGAMPQKEEILENELDTDDPASAGAILTATGNYTIDKAVSIMGDSNVTVNTHEYRMDDTITSTMPVYGQVAQELKDSLNKSHIIKFDNIFVGDNVTLNFVNEQISAGATPDERGKADYNGYVLVRDLNAFEVKFDANAQQNDVIGVRGEVNIGAKTIVQVTSSAAVKDEKTKEGVIILKSAESSVHYNITGENAALKFHDSGSSGINSFVDATIQDGGSVLLGGSLVQNGVTEGSVYRNDTKGLQKNGITEGVDLVITNKDGKMAELSGFKLNTANTTRTACGRQSVSMDTVLGGASETSRASMSNAVLTEQSLSKGTNTPQNNLLEHTDLSNTLVKIQKDMTLYMSDVTLDSDSKIQGEVVAQTRSGTADGKVVNDRPGAQSNAYTDTATRVSVTLTQDNANTVTSNTQNKLQVMKVDQLVDVDMLGSGLTIGISKETLESYRATCDILALEVTGTGIFTYEANGVLSGVQLADTTTGNIYATTDTSNPIAIADSAYVAYLLGVEKAQVSMNYIYIVLPEPTTGTLSLLALAALCARRRRTGAGKV